MGFTVTLWLLMALRRLRGRAAPEGMLGLIERRFVFSGWPLYGHGWTNLHLSRFTSRLRHALGGSPVVRTRRDRPPLKRVACVGRFVGLLGFPKVLMERCPADLVIADIAFRDQHAGYLRDVAADYASFDLAVAGERERLQEFVNRSRPELLLNIGYKFEAFQIIDGIDVPCIANYCTGSDLLHHPAVDVQYHGQPEADYFARDSRMFCGTTARTFGPERVHTITGYLDPRGLVAATPRPWSERESLIVCHGSLYKFASQPFLHILCAWLAAEPSARLVLMGRDNGKALAAITGYAHQQGVGARVDYRGEFSAVRDTAGDVSSAGWFTLVDLLSRARLAPNPFPMGGGSSRYEAYALGAPAPHLGVDFSPAAWGRHQPSVCEIPSLLVPAGTALTVADYEQIGRRCLRDGSFADRLAAEQLERARAIVDGDRWWREIVAGYEAWRLDEGAA